jgi:hypothetical protein
MGRGFLTQFVTVHIPLLFERGIESYSRLVRGEVNHYLSSTIPRALEGEQQRRVSPPTTGQEKIKHYSVRFLLRALKV